MSWKIKLRVSFGLCFKSRILTRPTYKFLPSAILNFRFVSYVQGQSTEKYEREYFYFIDHNGMLFLDDARIKNFTSCFKEKAFLRFFFHRLRANDTGFNEKDFPFISPCGKEMNYIRCDDLPIVFTNIVEQPTQDLLLYGHAGEFPSILFEPSKLCMFPRSGRVYHPAPVKGGGVGLVRSALSIEISKYFVFPETSSLVLDASPTGFEWKGTTHELTNELQDLVRVYSKQEN